MHHIILDADALLMEVLSSGLIDKTEPSLLSCIELCERRLHQIVGYKQRPLVLVFFSNRNTPAPSNSWDAFIPLFRAVFAQHLKRISSHSDHSLTILEYESPFDSS